MKPIYKEGDLVRLVANDSWALGYVREAKNTPLAVRECPTGRSVHFYPELEGSFVYFEDKVGLIVKVIRNRRSQVVGYRIRTEAGEWFCKSVLANKYFEPVAENKANGSGKVC